MKLFETDFLPEARNLQGSYDEITARVNAIEADVLPELKDFKDFKQKTADALANSDTKRQSIFAAIEKQNEG